MNSKNIGVRYLGNSGWAVETKKSLLIFDYIGSDRASIGFGDYATLNLNDYGQKTVYIFVSHWHEDHLDNIIFDWVHKTENIKVILGWEKLEAEDCIKVTGNENLRIDDLDIYTIKSSDEGVGFLVGIDGAVIMHLGDHANWDEELTSFYQNQIDNAANMNMNIDIAFIPVAKGSGSRPECLTAGALYLIRRLNPAIVFPMHANGREYLYEEFKEEIERIEPGLSSKIKCAKSIGQNWNLVFERISGNKPAVRREMF